MLITSQVIPMSGATFAYREKMEKKEFRVLIKHCFLMKKKTLFKQKNGSRSITAKIDDL